MLSGVISCTCRDQSLGNLAFSDSAAGVSSTAFLILRKSDWQEPEFSESAAIAAGHLQWGFTSALVSPLCTYILARRGPFCNSHLPRKAFLFLVQSHENPVFLLPFVDFSPICVMIVVSGGRRWAARFFLFFRSLRQAFSSTSMTVSMGSGSRGLSPRLTKASSG